MTAWLAVLDTAVGDVSAIADGGCCSGSGSGGRTLFLNGWLDRSHRLHPQARQCDRALLDPAGEAATVRPLWPPRGALLLFDDPAVVQARRKVRALPAPRCVSTFVVDSRHFAGSLWAPGHGTRMQDDPFRLLGRPRLLNVAVGFLGAGTRLSGPAQERYNAAPWPAGSFTPTLSGASR